MTASLLFLLAAAFTAGQWFWIIFVIATLFGVFWGWNNRNYAPYGFVAWILVLLIGFALFGSPINL